MAGQYWITRHGVTTLIRELIREPRNIVARAATPNWGLTLRENQIVAEIVAGSTNKQIAESLSLSEQTVKHHLTSIFDKVGASSRLELALMVRHFAVSHSDTTVAEESNLTQRNLSMLKAGSIELSSAPGGSSAVRRNAAEVDIGETKVPADPRVIRPESNKRSAAG